MRRIISEPLRILPFFRDGMSVKNSHAKLINAKDVLLTFGIRVLLREILQWRHNVLLLCMI